MNEEKIKGLLDFLKSIGFQGQRMENTIRRNIQLNLQGFSARHIIDHGEERMRYNLVFGHDQQFDSYRLMRYKATHRAPVVIHHHTVNGVDTAQLEAKMKELDWESYFSTVKNEAEFAADPRYAEVISMLNKLPANQDPGGIRIQEELTFKYWPSYAGAGAVRGELKSAYESSRDFHVSEWGVCNANLAYNILSGRFDDLLEQFSTMNLEEFPGAAVHHSLEKFFSGNEDRHDFKCRRNTPEGFVSYHVPISKTGDRHSISTYKVSVTPYAPIQHGIHNGIDTKALEDQMKLVEWRNIHAIAVVRDSEDPQFIPQVEQVLQQMNALQNDSGGLPIVQQLQLKYWTEAAFFDGMVDEAAWKYFDSIPKREQTFPVEVDAKVAFNLLCGRAVQMDNLHPIASEKPHWARFDLSTTHASGGYLTTIMLGFDRTELEARLSALPIPAVQIAPTADALLKGDITHAALTNGKNVFLESNPEHKTINVYSEDMRLIPVNLQFDPDWNPAKAAELSPDELKRKPRQNIIHAERPPDKGRDIRPQR